MSLVQTLTTAESSTSRFGPKTIRVWIKELLGWRVCWYRCWVLMRHKASAPKQTRSFATIRHSCYNTEYKSVKEPDENARRLMSWSSRASNDRRRIQVGFQKYLSTTVSFWAALGASFKHPPRDPVGTHESPTRTWAYAPACMSPEEKLNTSLLYIQSLDLLKKRSCNFPKTHPDFTDHL